MEGTQVPLWITVLLGALAVVGTIGGAWGGQLIAGRNERRRWEREGEREREAHWRDKRLEAYLALLKTSYELIRALEVARGLREPEPGEADITDAIAAYRRDVAVVYMVGSEVVVEMSARLEAQAHTVDFMPAAAEQGQSPDAGEKLIRMIYKYRAAMREQMRIDIAVIPRPERPARWWRPARPKPRMVGLTKAELIEVLATTSPQQTSTTS